MKDKKQEYINSLSIDHDILLLRNLYDLFIQFIYIDQCQTFYTVTMIKDLSWEFFGYELNENDNFDNNEDFFHDIDYFKSIEDEIYKDCYLSVLIAAEKQGLITDSFNVILPDDILLSDELRVENLMIDTDKWKDIIMKYNRVLDETTLRRYL